MVTKVDTHLNKFTACSCLFVFTACMYGFLLPPDLKKLTIQYAYNIYQKSILKDVFQNVLEECTDLSLSKHVYLKYSYTKKKIVIKTEKRKIKKELQKEKAVSGNKLE